MKYLIHSNVILDVTKPPYCADNSGKTDCTQVLCRIFDDVMHREIDGVEKTREKLVKLSDGLTHDCWDGFENRVEKGKVSVIYPETVPSSTIIYFPAGTYLVSDTVTYSFDDLKNLNRSEPFSELCRGIHIAGESMENTVIKLTDNNPKFQKGANRPLVNYINHPEALDRSVTNVSQLNTIEDITLDCGNGNEGAVGLRFMSINSGKIDNITVLGQNSYCGVQTALRSTASWRNISISGFDYGIYMPWASVNVIDGADLGENTVACIKSYGSNLVCKNIGCGELPIVDFGNLPENKKIPWFGGYSFDNRDLTFAGDLDMDKVYYADDDNSRSIPLNIRSGDPSDWVCVDDFGAVGDGVTDSTEAIQRAMNSGKPIIIFGSGHYFVSEEITVPATVKTVDFMFCDFFSGEKLINDRSGALFSINEDSEDMLFLENCYTFEQFYGYLRFVRHAARRDLTMKSIHNQASASYFNTVSGSRVYLDNCASTTGDYAYQAILKREGHKEDYALTIPYEFHGQTVYGSQVNPERAYIEMLCDNSNIFLDAYKVEGPGVAVKTINNGRTTVNIASSGIGYDKATNYLYETENGCLKIVGANVSSNDWGLAYHHIISTYNNGKKISIEREDLDESFANLNRISFYSTEI